MADLMPKAKTVMFLLTSKTQTPVHKKQEADSVFFPEKEKSKYLAESLQTKTKQENAKEVVGRG